MASKPLGAERPLVSPMHVLPGDNHLTKTRRQMARERRGARSSAASIKTLYYKTIYQGCTKGRREK